MPPLPDMGIESTMYGPISIDHIHRDPNKDLIVYLVVVPSAGGRHRVRKNDHWKLIWQIVDTPGRTVGRILHIVRELGYNHLTNWGPLTKNLGDMTRDSEWFRVAEMTLAQRKALEEIAKAEEVMEPDGEWNCQDWVVSVLEKAVQGELLTEEEVKWAIERAQGV
ncbi:hypothetical protein VNI00_001044 [Paramarasmius palmivorus]|uniref:Uncharacterized protein n=1 Tax=Paramarasmius palmivorus TaxID=297713 RepID=A0AAW0EB54_9AGAR